MPRFKRFMHVLPRQLRWRLGRAMYMDARGEIPNIDMTHNGELFLQRCVVDKWSADQAGGQVRENNFVVFDVGANRGDWTANLLTLLNCRTSACSRVSIVAFEPEPTAARHLHARFEGTSVKVEQLCLSSRPGTVAFYLVGPCQGRNSLYQADKDLVQRIEVQTDTVDAYCAGHGIGRVDLTKVDTEGHDYEVMLGAKALLEAGRVSVLQFEYNYRWVFARRFLKDVFDLVTESAYIIGKLQRDHVVILHEWHFELERFFEGNYVLIHERMQPAIPSRNASWDASNTMKLAQTDTMEERGN